MSLVILFLLTPLSLMIAVATRFGGSQPILNVVDYSRLSDAAAFNRWAGNRLFVLPISAIGFAGLATQHRTAGVPLLLIFFFVFLCIAFWVMIGSAKFEKK